MTQNAYIAMGSNLGDRERTIRDGVALLGSHELIDVVQVSKLIETDPVGPGSQGAYLNGAAKLKTSLTARALLGEMLRIETVYGRDRAHEERWGPRTLDLDVLVFGDQEIDEQGLCVPHPRLHERAFVLGPLNEIAPDLSVPGRGCVGDLYRELREQTT